EVIATEIALFEVELGEGMGAVDDGPDAADARDVADSFHRRDLAGDVDLVRDEDEASWDVRRVCAVHDRAGASVAGKCFFRARRGHGHAVRDGVSRWWLVWKTGRCVR